MQYGAIYYSEISDRIILVTILENNKVHVTGLNAYNSFDAKAVLDEILRKQSQLIGYL